MDDIREKLLEAHVRHEIARFKGPRLRKAVEQEVRAAFEWIQDVRLKDLVTPEQILGIMRRNVVELPFAGGIAELAGESSRKVLTSKHNRETTLEDIFPRRFFDEMVEKGASLENVRARLIHRAVHTPAYAGLISDVLYILFREYLLKGNLFAQKVPGVSLLVRLGLEVVDRTLPNLEAAVEDRVKDFIQANLSKALLHSERFLTDFLDEERIVEVADVAWDSIAQTQLAEHFSSINADDMEDFVTIGIEFWLHFRKTRYFERIYTEQVHYFFEKYGDREVDVILEDLGISPLMVIEEIMGILSPAVQKALVTGYLERRIRARLADFYRSKKAASLV